VFEIVRGHSLGASDGRSPFIPSVWGAPQLVFPNAIPPQRLQGAGTGIGLPLTTISEQVLHSQILDVIRSAPVTIWSGLAQLASAVYRLRSSQALGRLMGQWEACLFLRCRYRSNDQELPKLEAAHLLILGPAFAQIGEHAEPT
jgi:hypothetical protein